MKRRLAFLAAFLALSASAFSQASLSPSPSLPKVDGAVAAGEYRFTADVSGMTLGATLGSDGNLYLSIQAKTGGWVALGVGGRKMDGSRLFLAYDAGGKQVFNEQKGIGHSHADAADSVVKQWSVKAADGVMSLELELPASAAVKDGKLDLLYAYSGSTSYFLPHKARGSMTIAVGQ